MSPNDAELAENLLAVRAINVARYSKFAEKRKEPKLKLGDIVRLKTEAKIVSSSSRAYAEQYHPEYYIITRINRTMPIPMYKIKSMEDDLEVQGMFYSNELQKLSGDVFKIDTILRYSGQGRHRKALVKWKYLSEAHNSWVLASTIHHV